MDLLGNSSNIDPYRRRQERQEVAQEFWDLRIKMHADRESWRVYEEEYQRLDALLRQLDQDCNDAPSLESYFKMAVQINAHHSGHTLEDYSDEVVAKHNISFNCRTCGFGAERYCVNCHVLICVRCGPFVVPRARIQWMIELAATSNLSIDYIYEIVKAKEEIAQNVQNARRGLDKLPEFGGSEALSPAIMAALEEWYTSVFFAQNKLDQTDPSIDWSDIFNKYRYEITAANSRSLVDMLILAMASYYPTSIRLGYMIAFDGLIGEEELNALVHQHEEDFVRRLQPGAEFLQENW